MIIGAQSDQKEDQEKGHKKNKKVKKKDPDDEPYVTRAEFQEILNKGNA